MKYIIHVESDSPVIVTLEEVHEAPEDQASPADVAPPAEAQDAVSPPPESVTEPSPESAAPVPAETSVDEAVPPASPDAETVPEPWTGPIDTPAPPTDSLPVVPAENLTGASDEVAAQTLTQQSTTVESTDDPNEARVQEGLSPAEAAASTEAPADPAVPGTAPYPEA